MEKYIRESDAVQTVMEKPDMTPDEKAGIIRRLKAVPAADVVEVVRCGECKHYNDKLEMYSDYVCTIRHYCDGSPIIVGKDDFCSSGKRKDGGHGDGD